MGERIAFFMGQIMHDYQWNVIKGVSEEVEQYGYSIEMFSNFGTYGDNFLHEEGEKNILNLPYLKEYDGIVVAPDTFDIAGMYEALAEKLLEEVECPVVILRQEDPHFYNVLIDDAKSIESMVEHFITVHHKKRICFMTGKMSMVDAQRRLQGYQNAMRANGLAITEHMIFEGNYWRNKGEEAVNWFLAGEEMPEVIICSNDLMAISVCEALRQRGIRVPEDICVSGFDKVDEAQYYYPSMTTMEVQSKLMGKTAMQMIRNILDGKKQEKNVYVPVKLYLGSSCGCAVYEPMKTIHELYDRSYYLKTAFMTDAFANVELEQSNSLEELFQTAFKYSHIFAYDYMYVCLCEHDGNSEHELRCEENFTEDVVLTAIFERTKGCWAKNEKFSRKEILPKRYRQEKDIIYCYPLHYRNQCMGYLVIQTKNPESLLEYFIAWLLAFSNYMDKVRIYGENKDLMLFRKQSNIDPLTGLSNRRAFEHFVQRHYMNTAGRAAVFYIISCDMDGLKGINDTYGHMEGDAAIVAFADILKSVEGKNIACARVGGDEFQICFVTDCQEHVEELLAEIRKKIDDCNQSFQKPYFIQASFGYAFCNNRDNLIQCMNEADVNMYQEKMSKKSARNR